MKIRRILLLFFAALLIVAGSGFPEKVFAHVGGPPYVKINGQYAQTNPILNTTQPTAFQIGSDVASSSGLVVGTPVLFDVDEQFFPNPYAQAQNPFGIPVTNQAPAESPKFRWDFKDGSQTGDGNHITHEYTKPGTFNVVLSALFPGKTTDYAPVDTISLIVAPSKEYILPRAVITVNGQRVDDPLRDTLSIKPMVSVKFDASASTGNPVKYQWDFGDEKGSDKKMTTHRYGRDEYFPTVVLRVTDEHNISVDTYALLDLPFEKANPVVSLYYKIVDFISGLFRKD
jgi:hypothetical protein